ncbi:MAG: hypothetical protein RMY62_007765 [Nostoc sp. ZfuVER08]|jgi:hypothetical protein|uniref:Uncharacterized protein n=1 Tax=Nostoc punctiforme FACHB-252 TaxID=1357509 RepID=A0ABR8HKA7_NOSPU|nr:hypothetical protein [Nostoc punctiforme]MBD2615538.1 hypothetical protein [Nostoc punctiforme FACHB-252]MBL1202534.1 hypothetical protein [Nostoc sp. GBBB01]MDZ8013627.1 hypothetical protein [Nostoc sp. ZfuVER08]
MILSIEINFPELVLQRWQTAKDIVNQKVNTLNNSVEQISESLKAKATTTTNTAIDTVTTSLEQTWQTAEHLKNSTSGAIETAINSSLNHWLIQHPAIFRLIQILSWAASHPIISVVILIFTLAILWSIIKAIVRVIETASWSILQFPVKLLQSLIKVSFFYLVKVGSFAIQQIKPPKTIDNQPVLLPENLSINKQVRLAEITSRLEAIQKEQHELLQEAADLIGENSEFKSWQSLNLE